MARFRPLLALAVLFIGLVSSEAHARRGIIFIHSGEEMDTIYDPGEGQAEGLKVGYIYERFGVFWIFDVWSWNGRYCIFKGHEYEEITREQAAQIAGHPVGPSWEYKYPLGLIVIAGIVVLAIAGSVLKKRAAAARVDFPAPPVGGAPPQGS